MPCGTILVVEDEQEIREALQEALEMEGYRVRVARNGREGLDVLAEIERPCLILLDLMMPVLDGWGFRQLQLKDAAVSSVPVVVITAAAEKVDTIGANDFMKKPIELDALLQTVKQYCA